MIILDNKPKKHRTRPDKQVHTNPGDNTKYLSHNLEMWKWDKPDMDSVEAVRQRIEDYFTLCAKNDMKPTVAGMALAFGVERTVLWDYSTRHGHGAKLPETVTNTLKKAYLILTSQMEDYMQNGKINPVAGIFLMKNNMGYQDKQEVVLTPNNPLGDVDSNDKLEEKYIEQLQIEGKDVKKG